MDERSETYASWCRLLLNCLITGGQVAASLNEVRDDWQCPQFSPADLDMIGISDPFSPVCRLIRRAVELGYISPDDELLSPKPNIPPVNWKMTEV
jgi:hypothetical protein